MRDGTLLTTDLYLPQAPGRYPVILERNPYGGLFGGGCFSQFELSFAQFAQHGYVGVFQFVRGTFTSGGTFDPFIQELNDQYDATEWAAAQSWSTGRVGTTGGSYLGIDQWMGAIAAPPHLYAINPDISGSDLHDNAAYENGVFRWSDALNYPPYYIPDDITRQGMAAGLPPATIAQQIAAFDATLPSYLASWTYTLPLANLSAYSHYPEVNFFYTWLNNPDYDAYWQAIDTEVHFPNIKVPALIGGASMDIFNIAEIRNYQGMRAAAGTQQARAGTKLYWKAYGHAGDSGTPTFGDDAVPWDYGPSGLQLQFFDYYLKGIQNGYESAPNATIYVLVPPNAGERGSGFWLSAADFPLPGTMNVRLYLGSNGHANSRLGDGYLSTAAPNGNLPPIAVAAASDQFVYDPSNPAPTVGGNLLRPDTLRHTTGFADQSAVELRNDVLVYTSAVVPADTAVIGTVNASFWAITSAPDTDFTVKLVDVHPDGLTNNVMDRVVRARFRLGSKLPPSFIQAGQAYQYTLQVGNTATIFRQGHRVRVEISSSNFPKFARNLNTVQQGQLQSQSVVAQQTILHDALHPSYIELPVAPNVKVP
jgi:putative CocE/NonD family hydrolase